MCVDNGELMDAIYLNFEKAFDKVPHQTLLSHHGIEEIGYGKESSLDTGKQD